MSNPARVVSPTLAGLFDVLCLLVFALAGKSSHAEHGGVVEVVLIAWPFIVGAALGWLAHVLVRRTAPLTPSAGLWVVAGALLGGHVLRVLTGRGTALSFVLVSAVVLTLLLVGWRALARWQPRRRSGVTAR